jgi:hypothetical protein
MKAFLIIFFAAWVGAAAAQTPVRDLPQGAVVIETAGIASFKHAHRRLVLWMQDPKKNPNGYSADDLYTCPDTTRGSYYSGPTRVSLVNTATRRVINTIKISSLYDEDSFDLPYAIRKGNYYRVLARVARNVEARPNIMWLRDYNGDGRPLEFALFEAEACMGMQTTLIGYSEKQDRVINYPIALDVTAEGKHKQEVSTWVDYLFQEKPKSAGHWKYEIDYRGRAGSLEQWEVRYNAAKEQFEGTRVSIPPNLED